MLARWRPAGAGQLGYLVNEVPSKKKKNTSDYNSRQCCNLETENIGQAHELGGCVPENVKCENNVEAVGKKPLKGRSQGCAS